MATRKQAKGSKDDKSQPAGGVKPPRPGTRPAPPQATPPKSQSRPAPPQSGSPKSGSRSAPPRPTPRPMPRESIASPPPPPPPGDEEFDANPPIIISGGSVTIESTVFLTSSFDPVKNKYIYKTDEIEIGKIRTTGRRDEHDESNSGRFTIKLFKKLLGG